MVEVCVALGVVVLLEVCPSGLGAFLTTRL
ncbi:MAG: hypothetical protein ACI9UN_001591 [Granulosicoccus sp.]|jgi:hypothetical protein